MRMHITAQGFDMTDVLHESVMQEIERFLQSVDKRVNVVSVQLFDERGKAVRGLDRRCRVRVEFDDSAALEDSDSEADFDECVSEAFLKVMRAEQHAH